MLNMGQLCYLVEEVLPLTVVRRLKILEDKVKVCVHDMCRNEKCGERLPEDMRHVRDCLYNRFAKPLKEKKKEGEDKEDQTEPVNRQSDLLKVPEL